MVTIRQQRLSTAPSAAPTPENSSSSSNSHGSGGAEPELSSADFEDPAEFAAHFADILDAVDADDSVRQIFSSEHASQAERNKQDIRNIIAETQKSPLDTGSTEVQIAILTVRIRNLTRHLSTHRKDIHNRRGLLNLVQQRRKLLKYLKRRDVEAYLQCLAKFDIRALKAQSRR